MDVGESVCSEGLALSRPHLDRRIAMITPHGTPRLLGLIFCGIACAGGLATAAGEVPRAPTAHDRATVDRLSTDSTARTSHETARTKPAPTRGANRRSQPASMVAQAAGDQALGEPRESSLDGSLVRGNVDPVGFLEDCGNGCGPVCDCDTYQTGRYQSGPACGIEPGCGLEPSVGLEPGCGIQPGWSTEAARGIEPGCGIDFGSGLEILDPTCGTEPGCGVEGCTECGRPGEIAYRRDQPVLLEGPSCGSENADDCSCDACRETVRVDSFPVFLPIFRVNWCRFDFFAGVEGFQGPMNFATADGQNNRRRPGSGSFGFYQGFNEGRSLKRLSGWDMAGQFGLRATQSNLSGAEFTAESRHQVFLTGGLFRKVDYGLQYGMVLDYLNEDWYHQGDLTQLRGELSWKTAGCHTFGFRFMAGLGDDTAEITVDDGTGTPVRSAVTFEPTDQYRFFYRRLLEKNGSWDAYAGWTDQDQGILGADLNLTVRHNVALQTGVTYLIPGDNLGQNEHESEAWNLSLGLVFRPGGFEGCGRYCRPMFDVADNGSFIVRK